MTCFIPNAVFGLPLESAGAIGFIPIEIWLQPRALALARPHVVRYLVIKPEITVRIKLRQRCWSRIHLVGQMVLPNDADKERIDFCHVALPDALLGEAPQRWRAPGPALATRYSPPLCSRTIEAPAVLPDTPVAVDDSSIVRKLHQRCKHTNNGLKDRMAATAIVMSRNPLQRPPTGG